MSIQLTWSNELSGVVADHPRSNSLQYRVDRKGDGWEAKLGGKPVTVTGAPTDLRAALAACDDHAAKPLEQEILEWGTTDIPDELRAHGKGLWTYHVEMCEDGSWHAGVRRSGWDTIELDSDGTLCNTISACERHYKES